MIFAQLAAAAALGLVSSTHCVAMCGPLVAAGCRSHGGVGLRPSIGYFAGRAISYAAVGALAGAVGHPLVQASWSRPVRLAVGVAMAVAIAAAAWRWLAPRPRARTTRPVTLRRRARRGWLERVAPLLPTRGLGLGLVTGVFPCGALAAGVLAAATSGAWLPGAAMMLVFSLASAPALVAMLLVGDRAARWLTAHLGRARPVLGALALGLAGWIAVAPWLGAAPMPGARCSCHEHAGAAP